MPDPRIFTQPHSSKTVIGTKHSQVGEQKKNITKVMFPNVKCRRFRASRVSHSCAFGTTSRDARSISKLSEIRFSNNFRCFKNGDEIDKSNDRLCEV